MSTYTFMWLFYQARIKVDKNQRSIKKKKTENNNNKKAEQKEEKKKKNEQRSKTKINKF